MLGHCTHAHAQMRYQCSDILRHPILSRVAHESGVRLSENEYAGLRPCERMVREQPYIVRVSALNELAQ